MIAASASAPHELVLRKTPQAGSGLDLHHRLRDVAEFRRVLLLQFGKLPLHGIFRRIELGECFLRLRVDVLRRRPCPAERGLGQIQHRTAVGRPYVTPDAHDVIERLGSLSENAVRARILGPNSKKGPARIPSWLRGGSYGLSPFWISRKRRGARREMSHSKITIGPLSLLGGAWSSNSATRRLRDFPPDPSMISSTDRRSSCRSEVQIF
jgi:hypothetical protein